MRKNTKNTKSTVKTGRKRFATVTGSAAAVVLSAVVAVSSIWNDSIKVQAADTLLGIEKLRNQVQLSGKEYTILEIVPDKSAAEIGFWVDGYEPILGTWDEKGNWLSWKDQLVNYLTTEERKEFVERKKSELLAYYSSKYASTDKAWDEDFPVYGEEGEYEESDKPGDGFEEVSGSNISKTGYFDPDSSSGNGEKYQVAFELVGKNVTNSDVPQDVVYYRIDSTTNIEDIYKNLPEDVWVYRKMSRPGSNSEYWYEPHLWGQIKEGYQPASVSDDTDPGDDSDDDDDDDHKGSDGGNKGGDGDDSDGGDDGDDGDNGDGGNEGGDGGNEGSGDGGNEGGSDNGNEGGGDGDSTGGNDSDKGESGSGGNSGSGDNGSTDLSVRSSVSQGRWIKMVSENKDPEASDDKNDEDQEAGSSENEKPDPDKETDPDEETDPDKEADPDEETDPDKETDPDEEEDLDEEADPDEEEDSDEKEDADSISANAVNTGEGVGEWFLVRFKKIQGSTDNEMCYAVKDPYSIKRSTHGFDAYDFVEVELSGDEEIAAGENRRAQKYTFAGKIVYCKNTFKSNEWFKKYALDMDKKDYPKFSAKVITLTPKELNEMETLPEFDFLYLNSGSQSVFVYDDGKGDEDGKDDKDDKDDNDEKDDNDDGNKGADNSGAADDDEEEDSGKAADDEGADNSEAAADEEADNGEAAADDEEADNGGADDADGADGDTGFKLYVETGDQETGQETDQETGQGTEADQKAVSYGADNDLSEDTLKYLTSRTVAGALPCLVDGAILYVKGTSDTETGDTGESGASAGIKVNEDLKATQIFRLAAIMCQESPEEWYNKNSNNLAGFALNKLLDGIVEDADKNFVTENVYCRLDAVSIINKDFHTPTIYKDGRDIEPGFQKVLDEILLDNSYRAADSSGNYKALSTDIGQSTAVRHIINYQNRRKVETKEKIKVLEIQPAMADKPELTLEQIKKWAPGVKEAEITVMTTAEFVGKIEKLNETYDLIYIGTSKDHLNMRYWGSSYYGKPDEKHVAAGTVFNDADMDGLIYYNIGDLRVVTLPMAGLLTSEYKNGNRNDWTYFYNYVRYGGNDISKEKMEALVSFLDGSYPVIIADDFLEQPATVYEDTEYKGSRVNLVEGEYTQKDLTALGIPTKAISSIKVKEGYVVTVFDQDNFRGNSATFTENESNFVTTASQGNWNDRVVSMIIEREEDVVPKRRIDGDHIDNCTYLYEFVKKALDDKYVNFYAWGDIGEDSELFKFYLNRPKVSLIETEANGELNEGSDIYYINADMTGRYNLQFRFKIRNEGAASYNTRYGCKLYIDVNSDGKFSEHEEIEDISITQNGSSVSAGSLYADREYILSRQVPDGYKGLLPWRVEITQADNKNIYTSMSGYTKLNGMDKEVLKICQINKNGADVIDLNYEVNTKGRHFNTLVYGGNYDGVYYPGIADEFELEITTMDVNTFQSRYYANNEYLRDFNMLILGFSDMYGDFAGDSESGPMGAIVDFINSGKSVLLGHDTTSYFNSPDLGQGDQAMKGYPWRNNYELHDIWWYNESQGWWYTRNASTLNKYVRPLVGMDRYGILDSGILQRGNVLKEGSSDYDTVVKSGKDVAYKPKSGRTETVPEVHGYTYALISAKDQKVLIDNGTTSKYQYTKWNLMSNDYQRYPEVVFENKYTNIRFDAAWFWESYDGKEDDPARYGELEKVNNGEVYNVHATQVNNGQITEYPYKLKDEFEVAKTHTQYYELDYTADDDGDGESDLVVWYCLGGRTSPTGHRDWETTIYSQSPNDVRNNYYIYNKGNITYTGMGHARKDQDGEWYTFEEAKLFINTMIASYQAGVKQPNITVLKSGLQEAPELKTMYRYYDTSFSSTSSLDELTSTEDSEKIYFRVQDVNFVKGTRAIATHVFYETPGGGETIMVDGSEISVNRLADNMYDAADDSPADANNLKSNGIYYILVPKSILDQCDDGLNLYFEAQSTITTNTVKQNQYITDKVYAKLKVLKAFLFDLQ